MLLFRFKIKRNQKIKKIISIMLFLLNTCIQLFYYYNNIFAHLLTQQLSVCVGDILTESRLFHPAPGGMKHLEFHVEYFKLFCSKF